MGISIMPFVSHPAPAAAVFPSPSPLCQCRCFFFNLFFLAFPRPGASLSPLEFGRGFIIWARTSNGLWLGAVGKDTIVPSPPFLFTPRPGPGLRRRPHEKLHRRIHFACFRRRFRPRRPPRPFSLLPLALPPPPAPARAR